MAAAEPDLREIIGGRIARLRIARGESQEDLSLRSGVNRNAVGMIERGRHMPRADTLVKVAGALEVDAGEMLTKIAWTPITYSAGRYEVSPEERGGGER